MNDIRDRVEAFLDELLLMLDQSNDDINAICEMLYDEASSIAGDGPDMRPGDFTLYKGPGWKIRLEMFDSGERRR